MDGRLPFEFRGNGFTKLNLSGISNLSWGEKNQFKGNAILERDLIDKKAQPW